MALANYDRETEGRPLLEPTRKPRKATDQKTQSRYKLMQTEFRACPLDKVVEEVIFKRRRALDIVQCRLAREWHLPGSDIEDRKRGGVFHVRTLPKLEEVLGISFEVRYPLTEERRTW